MSSLITFDSTVAARTRAAAQILSTPDLFASYEAKGGTLEDLESIRNHGQTAESLSQAQSAAQAAGGAATLSVLSTFVTLQKEYVGVMGIVQAARRDLVKAGASIDTLSAVDRILVNEAEVAIRTSVAADGKKIKKAVKKASQEALRAEIAKDARALLALTAIHPVLANRKVDAARLGAMVATAESLAGKLAERASAKGAQKSATSAMHDAVSEQKLVWAACYRLLAALGSENAGVAQLLTEASRMRAKAKAKKA
jgi:hypothetical protein